MAKHRFQPIRWMQARHLLLSVLLLGVWGVSPVWGGQQPSVTSAVRSKLAQAGGPSQAKSTPVKSGQAAPQPKGTSTTTSSSMLGVGKRDPFKVPEVGSKGGTGAGPEVPSSGPLPQGERGLVISQLRLEGVVREQTDNKMIAVVINETKRAYFLHENQSVYNGVVSKITPDAVYFTENVLDANGRVTTREVVKRLGSAPGEER